MSINHSFLYKKFANYIPLDKMTGLQWFALEPNYGGTTYGSISKKYQFKRTPKLLDIGNADIRSLIKQTIEPTDPQIIELSDPNVQYSGGEFNKKYHRLVEKYFGNEYDGTIIDENHLQGNEEYSKDDLDGPSEIVLWKDYPILLDEVTQGGSKKKRKHLKNKTFKKRSFLLHQFSFNMPLLGAEMNGLEPLTPLKGTSSMRKGVKRKNKIKKTKKNN